MYVDLICLKRPVQIPDHFFLTKPLLPHYIFDTQHITQDLSSFC
jgi:hypothetical protein